MEEKQNDLINLNAVIKQKEIVEALEKQTELNAKVLKLIHEYINLNKSENNVDKPVMNIHTRGGGK